MPTRPRWPRALFFGTLAAALLSTALTLTYLVYNTRIEQQQRDLALHRAEYEARIAQLQHALVVEKVVSEQIPTPITEQDCHTLALFDQQICVPVTRVELREIKKTVQVEDPEVKAQLDQAYAELQALSKDAAGTGKKLADLQPYVDFVRKLMAPGISLLVLLASLYVILSQKYAAESEKWAFGSLGTILGYWLK